MEKIYENIKEYGEEMKGKFSHNPHRNGIVISVTSPFDEEIYIECDGGISAEYHQTYLLLEPQVDHPEGSGRQIYYNAKEKCYYRSEWRQDEGYIWVYTDKKYIVNHARRYERLQAHFRMYDDIHKGQLCVFKGYAVDPNGQYKRPSTVESMFDRHKWFYNPWSFEVSLLNRDTIDDFVEETPISKEMTGKMVRHHRSVRNDKLWANIRELGQNFKKPWVKLRPFFPKWFIRGVIITVVGGLILLVFGGTIADFIKKLIFDNYEK